MIFVRKNVSESHSTNQVVENKEHQCTGVCEKLIHGSRIDIIYAIVNRTNGSNIPNATNRNTGQKHRAATWKQNLTREI